MACQCCLSAITWAVVAYICYRIVRSIFNIVFPYIIATPLNLLEVSGGKWAVVTGSTDGIGKAYAFELARRGFNILLISRTQSKLDDVMAEIKRETNAEVKTVAFDFSIGNVDAYEKNVIPEVKALDVGILVNNVGVSFEYPEIFHKVEGGLRKLANVNIVNTLPTTVLTACVLPQMVARNSGIIVNVSSSAAYGELKMLGVYSATKKYVNWLSSILRKEYSQTNIIIQTVCPMIVATKMTKVKRPSFLFPSAEQFVANAVKTIGIISETTGYLFHQVQAEIASYLPSVIVDLIAEVEMRYLIKLATSKQE